MSDFTKFSKLVHKQYNSMNTQELYVMDIDTGLFFQEYLKSFPLGTDPQYVTKTVHNCSCCRNFIKNIGTLVTINNGVLTSVWDCFNELEHPYDVVAFAMSEYVKSAKIKSIFRTKERTFGNEITIGLGKDGTTVNYNHFYGDVIGKHNTVNAGTEKGKFETTVQVYARALNEFTIEAMNEVQELIECKSIYRGEEHLQGLINFRKLYLKYNALDNDKFREQYVWQTATDTACRFRNSVLGTLISDISTGKSVEASVKSFEAKVAPQNYKRPTALITPGMVTKAMETIEELNLRDALDRRFAVASDISVNDVLFADSHTQLHMKDPLLNSLMGSIAVKEPDRTKAVNISSTDFIEKIVPNSKSIKLFLENKLESNLVSLTAPTGDSKKLFKWDNNYAWSYNGDIADSSIKQRVKAAGGNVSAKFRVSLSWFNYDDLDIHVYMPNGAHIYHGHKGGFLDVDMNVGDRGSRQAVENVSWNNPIDGNYIVEIKQYHKRENKDFGFTLEIENNGSIQHYSYAKAVTGKKEYLCITMRNGSIHKITPSNGIEGGTTPKEIWGLNTEGFVEVSMMMLSPNHWVGNSVGNKHVFFMLENCINPNKVRGIYNEFLRSELEPHRKTFEILGSKTMCPNSPNQLSGIGISSTNSSDILLSVDGKVYNVKF
ncbi:MAG: hypothetical protein COA63_014240 [Methylophaga sp.]|nr:hypothetical protein [Methylophaga sp.]